MNTKKYILNISLVLLILGTFFISLPTSSLSPHLKADSVEEVNVGIYENQPFIYTDSNGTVDGIYADILEHIAEKEGWEINYIKNNWSQSLKDLEEGKIDIMTSIAYSQSRAERFNYTEETVLSTWGRIYGTEGSNIQSFLDLEGKKIAVLEDDIYYTGSMGIKTLDERFNTNCTFREVDEYIDVPQMIEDGEVDAGVVPRLYGRKYVKEFDIEETPVVFSPIELKFALSKNSTISPALKTTLDEYLNEMKGDQDSLYYESLEEHIGGFLPEEEKDGGEKTTVFPDWARNVVIGAISLIGLFVGASIVLKKQVSKKTEELKEANEKLQEYQDHLEDEVRKRTKELERSNEELERFAHTVSHDLRAPLRAMAGFSSALMEDHGNEVDDEARDMMERINASSKRMDHLITDLLKYSRLTRKDVEVESTDLEVIIDQVKEDLNELVSEERADIMIDRPLGKVEANETILRQALENLIKNGIKFVEEDIIPVIKIRTKEKNGMVRIEVEDNGIGISEDHGEKIFQMFERLHGREEYSGTGAGLALVKRGVEKMDGEVGFESEPGEGSTFWIELPKGDSGS